MALSTPLPQNTSPPTPLSSPSTYPTDPTSLLLFTCSACGSCFLAEAKLGDHFRRSPEGFSPGIHEASTPLLCGVSICDGCGLPFHHKRLTAHAKTFKKIPPRMRLQVHSQASLPTFLPHSPSNPPPPKLPKSFHRHCSPLLPTSPFFCRSKRGHDVSSHSPKKFDTGELCCEVVEGFYAPLPRGGGEMAAE